MLLCSCQEKEKRRDGISEPSQNAFMSRIREVGTGEMAQQLGVPAVLPEDPSSIPATHTVAHEPSVTPVLGNPTLSSGLCVYTAP